MRRRAEDSARGGSGEQMKSSFKTLCQLFAGPVLWRACVSFLAIVTIFTCTAACVPYIGPVTPLNMALLFLMCFVIAVCVEWAGARLSTAGMLAAAYLSCLLTVFGIGFLTDFIPAGESAAFYLTVAGMITAVYVVTGLSDWARHRNTADLINMRLRKLHASSKSSWPNTFWREKKDDDAVRLQDREFFRIFGSAFVFSYAAFVLSSSVVCAVFPETVLRFPSLLLWGLVAAGAQAAVSLPVEKMPAAVRTLAGIGSAFLALCVTGILPGHVAENPAGFVGMLIVSCGMQAGMTGGDALLSKADEMAINIAIRKRKGELVDGEDH